MVKKYYRVDIEKATSPRGRRYSVSDVRYMATSKQAAINKAKREGFRKRQKIPKEYKLYYSAVQIK